MIVAGGGGGGGAVVNAAGMMTEVTELTQLYEDKEARQRRTAGTRPTTGGRVRGQSASPRQPERSTRFPAVGE